MSRKFLTPIDLTGLEILNARFQNLATAPTPKGKGHVYYNTADDTVYVWDGTQWTASGKISAGVIADRPAAGSAGRLYFATDNAEKVLYYDNGTAWTQVGVGKETTDTLKNKTLDAAKVTGKTSFRDGSDTEYLYIERSYTGTARITAADDLALRATNDLILYPGNDVNGHPGKAYIHWGDDSANAYPEREIATVGTEQIIRGKTISDNLHFREGVSGSNVGYVHATEGDLAVVATDQSLYLEASDNVNINTTNGDIILNADGNAYLVSSEDPNNRIATIGDLGSEGVNSIVAGDNIEISASGTGGTGDVTIKIANYVNIANDLAVGSDAETETSHDAEFRVFGADGTVTFGTNSAVDETYIKGYVGFKNASNVEKAHFEHSGTGTFRITADEDLALRSNNGDVILYPGTEGMGGIGRAYVGWGNDATGAGLGNEILTRDANQVITNKTVNDELYFTNPSTAGEDGGIKVNDSNENFEIKAYTNDLIIESTTGSVLLTADGDIYKGAIASGNEVVSRNETVTLENKTLGSGTLLGANLDANEYKITGLADPEDDMDAANKRYVDAATAGLSWKQAVNLLYDAAIPVLSGSGATQLIVDGHTVLGDADTGYRLLLAGGTSTDGIYVYESVDGDWTLTRAADADVYTELKGAAVFVMEGDNYGSTSWVQSSHYITSFTGQAWVQFSGQGTYTAGDGLELNGSEFSAKLDGATLQKSNDGLKVNLNTGGAILEDDGLYVNTGTGLTISGNELQIDTNVVARKVAESVGNGTLTSFVLTHNFGTRDVTVTVYDTASYAEVFTDVAHSTINTVTVSFAEAPTTNQYRVVIVG